MRQKGAVCTYPHTNLPFPDFPKNIYLPLYDPKPLNTASMIRENNSGKSGKSNLPSVIG